MTVFIFLAISNVGVRADIYDGTSGTKGKLIWSDEFNNSNINNNSWKKISNKDSLGFGSMELDYGFTPELCEIRNGFLKMNTQMTWNKIDNKIQYDEKYGSSRVESKDLIECKYGRIEIRAKMPSGKGIWSNCYLMTDYDYAVCAIGSIMNVWDYTVDNTFIVNQSIIINAKDFSLNTRPYWSTKINSGKSEFHTYGMEWDKESISFFIDSNLIGKYKKSDSKYAKDKVCFLDNPFYIVLGCGISGNTSEEHWTKKSEENNKILYEDATYIDYVRVYSIGNNKIEKVLKKPVITKATKKVSLRKLTLRLKKKYCVDGYQIRIFKKKTSAKVNRKYFLLKKKKGNKKTIVIKSKKFVGKKKLYVRVRSYKKVKGKIIYSKWSNYKLVRGV